jgi:hypothetical protein
VDAAEVLPTLLANADHRLLPVRVHDQNRSYHEWNCRGFPATGVRGVTNVKMSRARPQVRHGAIWGLGELLLGLVGAAGEALVRTHLTIWVHDTNSR